MQQVQYLDADDWSVRSLPLCRTKKTKLTIVSLGGAGESGWAGVTAVGQGALFSMANVACRENKSTNIRFNEVYLNL